MIRALVIDDSAYNRVTIARMLESHPDIKVVATAVNGEDGIKQVMRHRPDVITLDLEMPVMDGFAFLRWLMHNLPTAVIAVSSRSSDRSVFKALELGAFDFIAKPGGRVSPRLEEIEKDLVAKVLQVAELRMENLRRRVAAEACGERLIAVIMTGMGDDGAEAMKRVRARGGRTIAESSETAIIFGMPNEAIKTGAVEHVLPLGRIPEAIGRLCAC